MNSSAFATLVHWHWPALARLPIGPLIKLIELVEDNQNVRYEEGEEYFIHTTLRLVRASAIEKNERKLHLEIEKANWSEHMGIYNWLA